MKRLPMETLESIIGIQKTTLEAFEKHGSEDSDYCPAYDKAVLMLLEELKQYRIAEDQGLLLRLPCKVGDAIYEIGYDYKGRKYINEIEMVIISANYGDLDWDKNEHKIRSAYVVGNLKGTNIGVDVDFCDFGRTVFLTKEEAEQALARMEGEDD